MPEPHVCSGEYREFVPDQRLVMTWIYNGPHPEDLAESLVTVDFVPINTDATEIRFKEVGEGLATDEERKYSRTAWKTPSTAWTAWSPNRLVHRRQHKSDV